MDVVFDATAIVQRTSLRGPYGHTSGDGNGDAGAQCRVNTPEFAFFSAVAAQTSVCFRAVCAITRSRRSGTLGVDAPDHERAITSIWRRFSHTASRGSRETLAAERQASPLPCTWTGGVKDGTAKGHNESGCRSRIRVRGERRICANASDHNQRNTDIRGSGSVCRRNGPRGSQSVLQSLADANTAEQQLDGHAARIRKSNAEQPDVSAVDERAAEPGSGASTCVRSSPSSIPCPTSIRTANVNERPGSATPSLELPRRVPCSAGGSCSVQARRSRFPRRRRESSARTPGRSAPMSEPPCSARTSSPTPSCSNGSRSPETAGTRTR